VKNDAGMTTDIVVHPVGIDDSIALAEDDVPLHVEFEGLIFVLQPLRAKSLALVLRPQNESIGLDVDGAEVRKPVHDDVHARGKGDDQLTWIRACRCSDLEAGAAPGQHSKATLAN